MSSLCARREGWGPSSSLRDFDLTPCTEDALLSSLFALFILVSSTRIFYLAKYTSAISKGRAVLWVKQVLLGVVVVLSLFDLIVLALKPSTTHNRDALSLTHLSLSTLSFLLTLPLTHLESTRSRRSSSLILIFAPVYLILSAIRLRTIGTSTYIDGSVVFIVQVVIPSLYAVFWIFECLGPEYEFTSRIRLSGPDTLGHGTANGTANGHGEIGIGGEKKEHESPLATANIYSRWTFHWMTPLMKLGASKFIDEDDLDNLLPDDTSHALGEKLAHNLQGRGLWTALFLSYGGPYAFAALLKIIQDSLAFLQPQLLRWLLSYISSYQNTKAGGASKIEGFAVAVMMFVAGIFQTVVLHQYFQICFTTGMRVRAGLVTAIYRKSLILSSDARGKRATGDIVNLMSVDATRLQDLCTYGLISISGPFQITLAFISLYNLLGWPAFIGVLIMILSIPLNTLIARYLKKLQEIQMKNRDSRTRLMSELLGNIKSVKLFAWEGAFLGRVLGVRNERELVMLRKIGIVTALNTTMWTGIPVLVAFSSFAVAAATGSSALTSDVIFPAISLFMLLQFPLAMFSQVTSNIIEALVSVNRLSAFLAEEELQVDARDVRIPESEPVEGSLVLEMKGCDFSWSSPSSSSPPSRTSASGSASTSATASASLVPTLSDISLTAHSGQLIALLGRVGSGKSSLLSSIIGEMYRLDGSLDVRGVVAYAPQDPWIQSASVRDNILFGCVFEEEFYGVVIEACALKEDLALLKDGDLTEVGEKGISLSGGQRARISLARAVYARADLYLLDDVLAAVDSHVARHVFDHVIGPRGLLSSKARIVVTNSIAFLSQYDHLAFIRRGIILEQGTYEELASDESTEVAKLIAGHGNIASASASGRASGATTPRTDGEGTLVGRSRAGTPPSSSPSPKTEIDEKMEESEVFFEKMDKIRKSGISTRRARLLDPHLDSSSHSTETAKAAKKEHSEQGRVKRDVYAEYIRAASIWGFTLFLITAILTQISSVLGNFTLRAWGEHNRSDGVERGVSFYLLLYGLFSLGSVLFSCAGSILIWVYCSLRSAKRMHDAMLHAVLRAPLSFFEQTPMGRIINLFSRDIYVLDNILGRVIQNLFRTLATILGIILVISTSFPLFLVAVPPLGYLYYVVMVYYLATSRELKRLDAVSKSPIFAWFQESLGGLSTIRGFSQQNIFMIQNEKRLDRNQMCYLPSISCNRWLAARLEFVGSLIILVTALLSIWALVTTGVDAGLVGLVLSYGLNTTGSLNWAVRSASEVETNIVSAERILHYIRLEPEAPEFIPENKPDGEWPTKGLVEFRDYSMRYRKDLDLVLKDINLTIQPREKIGVCGRTGAGKSSLLLALFRIIEPAAGTIFVDGVDITTLGLHDLRSVIGIIPQEPQLFEGTLRENIDPTGSYDDAAIWVALEQSDLRAFVETLDGKLDAPVREGGASLSSGQRQLLCFARALLRKSKILVLDEATSAVDLDTDKSIQQIIRGPQFVDVTMLTIAHRLNTIIDSDRVLVLDAGRVAEFDTPKTLLEDPNSRFYSLALEAGLTN